MEKINAVIGINKPPNFTSFDVIAKLRGMLKIKKIGHAGTLDPMATGVLPILIGKATKLCNIIPDTYKEYIACFKLGILTDTLDITGQLVSKVEVSDNITETEIKKNLQKYLGKITQKVPMYSAVKVNGQKLYDLAHRGQKVEQPQKQVHISKIELIKYNPELVEGKIMVGCYKGTYIRALIDDLGKDLGCYATTTAICRIRSCGITFEETINLEKLEELIKTKNINKALISMDSFFKKYRAIEISEAEKKKFLNGVMLLFEDARYNDQEIVRIYSRKEFLGLAIVDLKKCKLRLKSNLAE